MSDNVPSMLSVDEALHHVLAAFSRLPTEEISIEDGLGRVLTEDAPLFRERESHFFQAVVEAVPKR